MSQPRFAERADHCDPARARGGIEDGCLSQIRDQQRDVLQMESNHPA
jgi:hypothetical protein